MPNWISNARRTTKSHEERLVGKLDFLLEFYNPNPNPNPNQRNPNPNPNPNPNTNPNPQFPIPNSLVYIGIDII